MSFTGMLFTGMSFIALISNCSQIILIIVIQLCKVIILSECICDIGICDSDICKN